MKIDKKFYGLFALSLVAILPTSFKGVKASGFDWENAKECSYASLFESADATISTGDIQVNNSALYNGVIFRGLKNYTVTYKGEIDISDNTKDSKLFEFITMPDVVGVYDYRGVMIKFYEIANPDNYFSVSYYYDSNSGGIDKITTGGNNQEMYGLKYIRECDEYDFTGIPQAVSGSVNGSTTYQSISLYYDKSENALYADPVHDYRRAASTGKQLVRDFDTNLDYKLYGDIAPSVHEPAWNGFATNKIGLEVSIQNTIPGSFPTIGFLNVDGEYLANRIKPAILSKGLVNHSYKIPEAEVYSPSTNSYRDIKSSSYFLKVMSPSGGEVSVIDNAFTPDSEGRYSIYYGFSENNINYFYKAIIDVVGASEDISFDLSECEITDGAKLFIGNKANIKIGAKSDLLVNPNDCETSITLYKGQDLLSTFSSVDTYEFTASEIGEYSLVCTAKDYVGREKTETINFEVVRTRILFKDPLIKDTLVDRSNPTLTFSLNDLDIKDINGNAVIDSRAFASISLDLFVKKGEGQFTSFNDSYTFVEFGDYVVKYAVTYKVLATSSDITCSILRNIKVVDNDKPVFTGTNVIANAKLIEEKSNENTVWYKAKVGNEITVNKESAKDLRSSGFIELGGIEASLSNPNGEYTNITSLVGDGYKFTPSESGLYYVQFSVSDGVNVSTKTYVLEAKENWVTMSFENDLPTVCQTGSSFTLPTPSITNYDDVALTNYNLVVRAKQGLEEVTIENFLFNPTNKGAYEITYTLSAEGENVTFSFTLEVKDLVAPTISVSNFVENGYVNETFVLPNISYSDDVPGLLITLVTVSFNNELIASNVPSFIPTAEGNYVIHIVCVDEAGNQSSREFTVNITAKSNPGKNDNEGCSGSIAVTSFPIICSVFALLLAIKNKKEN